MAQVTINNGDRGLVVRNALNTMFEELYGASDGSIVPDLVGGLTAALALCVIQGGGHITLLPNQVYATGTKTAAGNFFEIPNNTRISGPRSAVVRVAANAGDYQAVFASVSATAIGIEVEGITIDQNADANTTCNITAGVASKTQYAVYLTAPQKCKVNNNCFLNAPGVNTVSLNGYTGYNSECSFNSFYFKKGTSTTTPYYDNSAIYINSRRYKAIGNYIENLGTAGDGVTGVELHGSDFIGCENVVVGYQVAMNIVGPNSANDTTDYHNIVVSDNIARQCRSGIALWALTSSTFKGAVVSGNELDLDPSLFPDIASLCNGIGAVRGASSNGDFVSVTICDNIVRYKPGFVSAVMGTAQAGIEMDHAGAATDVRIERNRVYNSPDTGIRVAQTSGAYEAIGVEGNRVVDAGGNTSSGVRYGVFWSGVVTRSRSIANRIYDAAATIKLINGQISVFLTAGSTLETRDNISESPNAATHLINRGGAYDRPVRTTLDAVAASSLIKVADGVTRHEITVSVTSAITLSIDTSLYPVPIGERINLKVINTSGGTTAITWSSDFIFAAAWAQLTVGQAVFLEFELDGTHWLQSRAAVVVTP